MRLRLTRYNSHNTIPLTAALTNKDTYISVSSLPATLVYAHPDARADTMPTGISTSIVVTGSSKRQLIYPAIMPITLQTIQTEGVNISNISGMFAFNSRSGGHVISPECIDKRLGLCCDIRISKKIVYSKPYKQQGDQHEHTYYKPPSYTALLRRLDIFALIHTALITVF